MITMNNIRKGLFATVLSLGLGSFAAPSLAQIATPGAAAAKAEPGRYAHAASREERQAKRAGRQVRHAERFAKRQAALHDALKLTSGQEGAWNAYVNASKPVPRAAHGERPDWKTLSAPARMEKRLAMSRERIARMEARLAALNGFYTVLSAEQRKTFDDATAQRAGRHGRHAGHGHHGGQRMQG